MADDAYSWLDALPSGSRQSKGDKNNPLVYVGAPQGKLGYVEGPHGAAVPAQVGGSAQADAQSVVNLYYDWDDQERAKFRSAIALTGQDTTGWQDADWANAWTKYVAQAATYYRNGQGKQLTPWDIIAMNTANREAQGPKTTTSTNTSVNLSSKEDVEATAYDIARSLLGRAPTDAEISQYTSVIQAKERANPTSTTTTTTTQPSGSSSSSTTTSGGYTAAAAQNELRKQVQGEGDYAEYQAATTYYNALMQMLGG